MTRDRDLVRRGDAPERIWLTTTETGKVDDFTRWTDQPPRKCDLWDTEYIRADLTTPAPVVPAEGLVSTLEMVYRNMPDIPELPEAYQPRNIARSLAALRSAPPVGARVTVKPGEIERAVWSAMIWAASNNAGFNGVPEYTDRGNSFAEDEARRAAARILAALLPAGEGE